MNSNSLEIKVWFLIRLELGLMPVCYFRRLDLHSFSLLDSSSFPYVWYENLGVKNNIRSMSCLLNYNPGTFDNYSILDFTEPFPSFVPNTILFLMTLT